LTNEFIERFEDKKVLSISDSEHQHKEVIHVDYLTGKEN